jgi:hypothetical protein
MLLHYRAKEFNREEKHAQHEIHDKDKFQNSSMLRAGGTDNYYA